MPAAVVINGQVNIMSPRQTAALNGQYYVATNPTPGTGVVCGTVTAFSTTADGLFTISNGNQALPGGRTILLDTLTLNMSGTAPTATTVMKMAAFLENRIVAPSAGNVAVVAQPMNPAIAPTTGATINGFSAAMCTIPAVVGTRTLVGNWSIPTSLGITGDSYTMIFGADPTAATPLTAVRATAAANIVTAAPPVSIPPGYTAILDWWWVGQATNGPTFEFTLGYYEY
jgi:hypothetical protein